MRYERSGATGGIVEQELVGKSRYEAVAHADSSHFEYIPFRQAMVVLKSMQPFDPTDPTPDFANTVHYYIYEGLGVDAEGVKFYTAVRSPLDRFHGVDAWFEVGDKVVTLDVTMNQNKDDGYKADVTFVVPNGGLDRKVDKEQFIEYSQKLAEEVLRLIKES